jgi:small subunit ribosomal protein S17e
VRIEGLGKVRTSAIKRLSRKLVQRYPDNFGSDFETNKNFLNALEVKMSKKMRNKIVGYVTQLKQIEMQVPQQSEEKESYPSTL